MDVRIHERHQTTRDVHALIRTLTLEVDDLHGAVERQRLVAGFLQGLVIDSAALCRVRSHSQLLAHVHNLLDRATALQTQLAFGLFLGCAGGVIVGASDTVGFHLL
ncbi:hypothetical protein D3C72_1659840 [compost metagenome]